MSDDVPRAVEVHGLFEPRDLRVGLYWDHDVQGWDGGWWESWRFYLALLPALVILVTVDRSNRPTRAYTRWCRETGRTP